MKVPFNPLTDKDKIRLMRNLCEASAKAGAYRGTSKTWNAREDLAAKRLFGAFVGRAPTEAELRAITEGL
jgi:hypothetical protein